MATHDLKTLTLVTSGISDTSVLFGSDTGQAASAPDPITALAVKNYVNAANQPLDATLTAFAALSGAADKLPYFTGSDAFVLADLTAFGRSLIDDANAAAALTTLGAAASAITLTAGAGLTGGGDLSANRTFAVGAGTGIAVNADDVALAAIADDRVLSNISGSSAAPVANTLTATIDACIGNTQGNILYRDGSAWVVLAPGTSGQFLKTQGAGANPIWDAAATVNAVTAAATITANRIVLGDDGSRGVKQSVASISNTGALSGLISAVIATGTITASTPALDITQTWNDAGVTFSGIFANFTNTNSAAASKLFDLQLSSTSLLSLRRDGLFELGSASINPTLRITRNLGSVDLTTGGTGIFRITGSVQSMINGPTDKFVALNAALTVTYFTLADDNVADVLALRRTTNAQAVRLYDTFASSTDFHRLVILTARATLSGVTGASVTATNLIPDGAVVVGVTTKVTTALGTTGGTTGYQVGDGTDVDRWGAIVGTAAGTSSDNTNWTATTVQAFIAANNVVITATGGNFDGTGVIYVSVQYLIGQCD